MCQGNTAFIRRCIMVTLGLNMSKDLSLPALPHPYQLCFACPGTFLTWVTMSNGASGHTQNGTAAPLDVAVQPPLDGRIGTRKMMHVSAVRG